MKQIIAAIGFAIATQMFALGQIAAPKDALPISTTQHNLLSKETEKVFEDWMKARADRDQTRLSQFASDDYTFTTANGEVLSKSQIFSQERLAEIDLPVVPISSLKREVGSKEVTVSFTVQNNSPDKNRNVEPLEITQKNVQAKWLNWMSQMERRADLTPNLVETAKLGGINEEEFWGRVAKARSILLTAIHTPASSDAAKLSDQIVAVVAANNEFGKILNRIHVFSEDYPQLGSNEAFQKFVDELSGIENRLAVARVDYYVAVRFLNQRLDLRDDKITAFWRKMNGTWKLTAERTEKIAH